MARRGSYGDGFRRGGQGLLRLIVHAAAKLTAFLSFGRLTADYIDLVYIAVKGVARLNRRPVRPNACSSSWRVRSKSNT